VSALVRHFPKVIYIVGTKSEEVDVE
jgi:hypothetical protein